MDEKFFLRSKPWAIFEEHNFNCTAAGKTRVEKVENFSLPRFTNIGREDTLYITQENVRQYNGYIMALQHARKTLKEVFYFKTAWNAPDEKKTCFIYEV